ncbi:hypothetical protein [Mesorhizobium temperatum]|uniref:Uncharacterized protein n=1 Tax=Mesorhizobium temperatum TaxID=241416 RepID=A0A271LN52_9HYPH|nr:hypothetical protein [Mesorhizobium temperatum]PAQ09543.1 hypothetical protein CIT26_13550 [Mesorhizobium temperatum]
MEDLNDEFSEKQLQRMAEKLLAGYRAPTALSGLGEKEQRMAAKLLGASNAERLARTGGNKPFKYRRPTHVIEYYMGAWGWAVDLIENGKRLPFKSNLDDEKLALVLAAIKQKGVPVRRFETEGEKQDRHERERRLETNPTIKSKPKSARFDVLDELRGFRL